MGPLLFDLLYLFHFRVTKKAKNAKILSVCAILGVYIEIHILVDNLKFNSEIFDKLIDALSNY